MKAKNMGIFSAVFTSICCLGPVILALVGLGGLGLGAVIGRYHWWFLAGGVLLIITSWGFYFKEQKTCNLKSCQMQNKRMTQVILVFMTLIVVSFMGLNIYANLGKSVLVRETAVPANTETVVIPVEGMSCFTCEVTVASALKRVDGVVDANASVKQANVRIIYEPEKTDVNQLVGAINKTGYKASLPK